jgi:RNA polymerase sigma-70 factor (ECF subfamily)
MNGATDDCTEEFTALYEASYGAIYAYAARRVGAQVADEIAAETFLVAWRRWDAIPSEPLPWLYGVARNVVARHHSATGRRQETEAALARERTSLQPGTPPQPEFHEAGDPVLWEAWEQLSPGDREVLSLVAWEELSVADAARALGCSPPVFSVRLHRARRRLERMLAATPNSPFPSTELSEA